MIARPPTWIVGLAWLSAGCIRTDPNHCHHNGGDEACGGATRYCDACASSEDNRGCVSEPPAPSCASTPIASNGSSGSSGDDTDASGSEAGSTSETSECVARNARDDACPDERPYCVDDVCIDCLDSPLGGDGLCAAAEPELPYCAPSGKCTACDSLEPNSCPTEGEFCQADGTCGGCFEHEQCGDHGCDLASGQCMSGFVFWMEAVSPLPAGDEDCGFGLQDDPWCKLSTVANEISSFDEPGTQVTVHMQPGNYVQSFVYDGPALVVFVGGGEDGGVSIVAADETSAIELSGGGRVYASDIRFEGRAAPTINCDGGEVWLQDFTIVDGVDIGLRTSNCDVTLERGIVARNARGGVESIGSNLVLASTGIVANGDGVADVPGVLVDAGTFEARHVTLVDNLAQNVGRNLRCRNAPTTLLRNSIVMGETGNSISGCGGLDVSHSIVDVRSLADDRNGVRFSAFDVEFFVGLAVGNPRLQADAPFDGLARWAQGDPALDIDREWLNAFPDATNDPGCDQRTTPDD